MRRHRKQMKEIMVVLLTLSLIVAMVQPLKGYAADLEEEGAEVYTNTMDSEKQIQEENQKMEQGDSEKPNPEDEEKVDPEENEKLNQGDDVRLNQKEKEKSDQEEQVVQENAEMKEAQAESTVLGMDGSSSAPVIISVDIDQNGKDVKEGDTVNITIEAKGNDGVYLNQEGSVMFYAVAQNLGNDEKYRSVPLEFSKDDNKYHGTLVIKDMYPCEWYMGHINIGFGDSWADGTAFTNGADSPYYIRVRNGDVFVNPEFDVDIYFMALDENGNYTFINSLNKKNIHVQRGQTLKEIGITFPEKTSNYPGLTQIGWMDHSGNEITENTQLIYGGDITICAKYDKGILSAHYDYPDSEGNKISIIQPIVYEHGETYGDALKKVQGFMPENIMKEDSFTNWESQDNMEDVISGVGRIFLTAKFSGVDLLEVYREYYDVKGSARHGSDYVAVKEGTKTSDAIKTLNNLSVPEMYAGLRFKEWNISTFSDADIVENGQFFILEAVYENCLVRYIINNSKTEEGTIFCQVAEKGETVTALSSFEGFGEVTWVNEAPSPTFVVNDHMSFYGKAELKPGDINNDGSVDVFDLMMCLNHVAGKTELEGNAFAAANVVEDEVVDLYDLMKILNHIAKGSTL